MVIPQKSKHLECRPANLAIVLRSASLILAGINWPSLAKNRTCDSWFIDN